MNDRAMLVTEDFMKDAIQRIERGEAGSDDAPPQCFKAVAPNDPTFCLVGNVVVKQIQLDRGHTILGHKHTFDHHTLLTAGRVATVCGSQRKEFAAPCIIVVRAHKHHVFQALEDGTILYCIHAIRASERVEDIVDEEKIPPTIYPFTED